MTSKLISIDEASQRISRSVLPISCTETLPIHDALARVLAKTICAKNDMPRFDHAAMDGYAVGRAAFSGDGPWLLPVSGRIAAGAYPNTQSAPSDACRIFTGAPLLKQFDCVVMQEKAEVLGNMIRLSARPEPGENVRGKGEEYQSGAEILSVGTVMTPRSIAACAAAGQGNVRVQTRVRVALIATVSEVATPGVEELDVGQIWDVNTPMMQSLLSRPDVNLHDSVRAQDNVADICCAMQSAAARADLIVTTGGVSVGDEDHLHAAAQAAGGDVVFAGVAIKPGKPITLGRIGNATWLGLPGNPRSAFVTWSIFGDVVLNTLAGRREAHPKRRHVLLGHDLSRKAGRCEIRAARIVGVDGYGRDVIECKSGGNSGQVSHFAEAEGLAFLPSEVDQVPAGSLIEFLPLCAN
nr:molybdopterin molybdotransferase MoeA [uncultured Tateyamaria sp.]